MINIILVSHGNLAKEFLHTAEMIMGETYGVDAVGIQPGETKDDFVIKLEDKTRELYTEGGVLVLADLFGGTPCNASALNILNKFERIQIISGLSLNMLLEALVNRNRPIEEVTEILIDAGCSGVIDVNKVLGSNNSDSDDE